MSEERKEVKEEGGSAKVSGNTSPAKSSKRKKPEGGEDSASVTKSTSSGKQLKLGGKPKAKKASVDSSKKSKESNEGDALVKEEKKPFNWKRLVAILVVVAVVAGAVGFVLYHYMQELQRQERLNYIANNATGITDEISTALTAKAPSTWVYDRDENLIMTLKVSDNIQSIDSVPTELATAIRQKSGEDLVALVVSEYIYSHQVQATEEMVEGFQMRVRAKYTDDDLIRYLAITSDYGPDYKGVVNASNNLFGLSVQQLTAQQLEFLGYLYRTTNGTLESYLKENNLTEDRLGIILHRSDYSAMRTKLIEELSSIQNINIKQQSYMVKLSTSTQQQAILQTLVDDSMRQLIDLNTDGTYTLDCSIAIADRNSGYIRAWVSGRTTTAPVGRSFALNTLGFIPNYKVLAQELSNPSTLSFALRKVEKVNGDTELHTLDELFNSQELSTTNSVQTLDAIGMMRELLSINPDYKGTTLVYQVTDLDGNTMYKAPGDSVLYLGNRNLCQYLSGSDEGATVEYGLNFELDTGVIHFKSTADYVVVVLAGSGAIGGSVTRAQCALLQSTVDQVLQTVATFYPTPTRVAWDATGLDSAYLECYRVNQRLIEDQFTKQVSELSAVEINSRETRAQFEMLYEDINGFIDSYEECVGAGYADSLRNALQQVRAARTDLLVQYST